MDDRKMAYGNVYRKLNRSRLHRKALLKNLAIALVKHERIVTTLAKAKEMRRVADRVCCHCCTPANHVLSHCTCILQWCN